MNWQALPTQVLGVTVCFYWIGVAVMVLRVSPYTERIGRVLIPDRPIERLLWLIWVPLVLIWMALPVVAAAGWSPSAFTPTWPAGGAESAGWTVLRGLAAGVAVLCLVGSIRCWRHMGARWRMAVDPRQRNHLIADGPFALVRHPIYALGLLLALCSAVVLPSLPMLAVAAVYGALIIIKVSEEERFLSDTYGRAFVDYRAATGRFVPRPAALLSVLRAAAPRPLPDRVGPHALGAPARNIAPHRLTPFQQAMLLWERLHPYNAAHAVHLAGPARSAALQAAINRVCGSAGIGALAVDEERGTFEYRPGESVSLMYIECRAAAQESLSDLLTADLNTPFSANPEHPVRWTILDDPHSQTHFVIAVYRHVAADAQAIELLFSAVLSEYAGVSSPTPALTWRGFDYYRLLTPLRRVRLALAASVQTAILYFRFRFMHKMPDERTDGDQTRTLMQPAPPGLMERLSRACRAAEVGPNDAFAAAFVSAVAALTPDRHSSRHRRALSLFTSLDARPVAESAALSNWFGNCVGDMLLMVHRPDDGMREIVAQVSRQSRVQKRRRAAALAVSSARLFFVRCIWPLFHVPHHRRSYRKLFPACGGISTVRVSLQRPAGLSEQIIGYWRACPPGPAMPIVLAPTILNSDLTLGLTYRTSCLSAAQAGELLDIVFARLDEFAAPAGAVHPSPAAESVQPIPANVG